MWTKLFVVFSVLMLAAIAAATYQDVNTRQYLALQAQYQKEHPGSDFAMQVQQLFPAYTAGKVGDTFRVERCISCHVPDIGQIGPEKAAENIAKDFFAHAPDARALAATYHLTGVHPAFICGNPTPAASTTASSTQPTSPSANPAQACSGDNTISFGQYGPDGVIDITTGGTTYKEPGYLPAFVLTDQNGTVQPKFGIDQVGCVVCHNGQRLALTASDAQGASDRGAHENLIVNPTYVWTEGANLYYHNCVSCHALQGRGGTGPPLSNQDRLGFFNEDYYYRCIEYGMTGFEHLGSIMPNWGSIAPDFASSGSTAKPLNPHRVLSEDQINILVQFIRHWENYTTQP